MFQRSFIDRFLQTLKHIRYGSLLVVTPDGKEHYFYGAESGVSAHMRIMDWRVIPGLISKGDIGLTESYRDGGWDTENLTDLLIFGLQNESALDTFVHGGFLARMTSRVMYFFTQNTLQGSRRNIHAHYDLGNDFYKLWLDPSMSYSSALFSDDNESLEQAQYNKYDRMLDRLEKSSGSLLEIGCGWGGLAERAVTHHNFDVKGITLSEQQHAYATTRLDGNARIALEDYRIQEGKYDHIISIEMFEAVGEKYWPTYFQKVAATLKDKGKAVIQTITIGEPHFERYRKGGDMIRTFIFPGGMLPTPKHFAHEASKAGLRVTDNHAFGHDYARTLQHWLAAFEGNLLEIKRLGFDEAFIRVWRFYLSACIASFVTGRTDVMQMELQHA